MIQIFLNPFMLIFYRIFITYDLVAYVYRARGRRSEVTIGWVLNENNTGFRDVENERYVTLSSNAVNSITTNDDELVCFYAHE